MRLQRDNKLSFLQRVSLVVTGFSCAAHQYVFACAFHTDGLRHSTVSLYQSMDTMEACCSSLFSEELLEYAVEPWV